MHTTVIPDQFLQGTSNEIKCDHLGLLGKWKVVGEFSGPKKQEAGRSEKLGYTLDASEVDAVNDGNTEV